MMDWTSQSWATLRPPLRAHSSATALFASLRALIHPQDEFRSRPPIPTQLHSPEIDPSMFNFTRPTSGLTHLIQMVVHGSGYLTSSTTRHLVAVSKRSRDSCVLMGRPWKTTSFPWFQSALRTCGKIIFQGIIRGWVSYASQLVLTHSQIPIENAVAFDFGIIS